MIATPELTRLLQTIDDDPDPLHADITPSVLKLRALGEPALGALVETLASERWETRLHAQRSVEWITKLRFGFDGQWTWAPGGLERWQTWWDSIGFSHDAPATARATALTRLQAYVTALADNH